MTTTGLMSPERGLGEDTAAESALGTAQREFWTGLATALGEWSRGVVMCLGAAAVVQGILSAFPVMVWWGVPVTVPISALAIALVSLRRAPQWGPVFAACVGLLADAASPALLGATAWAYLPVVVCFTLLHRHLRQDHAVILVLYASSQALVQTAGTYVGLRLAGLSGTAGHVACASVFLSAGLAGVAAAATALGLRFYVAVRQQLGRNS